MSVKPDAGVQRPTAPCNSSRFILYEKGMSELCRTQAKYHGCSLFTVCSSAAFRRSFLDSLECEQARVFSLPSSYSSLISESEILEHVAYRLSSFDKYISQQLPHHSAGGKSMQTLLR